MLACDAAVADMGAAAIAGSGIHGLPPPSLPSIAGPPHPRRQDPALCMGRCDCDIGIGSEVLVVIWLASARRDAAARVNGEDSEEGSVGLTAIGKWVWIAVLQY